MKSEGSILSSKSCILTFDGVIMTSEGGTIAS